ncbi:HAD family phosphatase [Candidatus Saccharibacteria bacterium]|nr:MAG: HAD family phosphatase [Candidatus Saccharibacteria bacterium]
MSKIETVIFDAGGVLHESNSAVTEDLANELGLSKETLAQIWAEQIPLLGSGKIDETEFWQQVSEKHGLRQVGVDENLLGRAFIEQLVPFAEVRTIVKDLGELGIKTAVLSNTIEPHAKALREAGLYDDFGIVLLSHEIGLRKPHKDIYEYALETLGAKADQTIFIDDDPENAQAATSVGMHGITFTSPDQLRERLKELIPEL